MGAFDSRGDPVNRAATTPVTTNIPASCPTCRSSSIVTTAKIPDSSSYWRCTACGHVWNESRGHNDRNGGGRRWR